MRKNSRETKQRDATELCAIPTGAHARASYAELRVAQVHFLEETSLLGFFFVCVHRNTIY